ncbi:hypothetical protein ANCCEY_07769 [Ancylostoma ceylanicum]|uniref:Uncharacterized protein n=1 Tax=Ancylostoma ceylanicum TaxID=53326 RepID=A0A0D6LPK8_9BILA|nr:hypothetical protein ANCCEY_07769 [Ancylostoma ceylanicum]
MVDTMAAITDAVVRRMHHALMAMATDMVDMAAMEVTATEATDTRNSAHIRLRQDSPDKIM